MSQSSGDQRRRSLSGRWMQVAALVALACFARPAAAAESVLESSSLKYAPEDASFYWAQMRMREQVEAVMNSRAVAKLLDLPLFKEIREQAAALPAAAGAPDVSELQSWFDLPENKQLQELLLDAVSHEVFIYGDASYADLMRTMNTLSQELNALQIEEAKAGGNADEAARRKSAEVFLRLVKELRVPATVIGFKLSDGKPAEAQLARLEALLMAQIEMQPPAWQGRLKREQIGGAEFLTLRLDGTLIPWDQIRAADAEVPDPEAFEQMKEALNKRTVVVSIGIREGYLLVTIGDGHTNLQSLGQGKLLAGRQELAPLAKHADKPLTSVSYVSQKFAESSNSIEQQIDGYVSMVERMLPLAELDAGLQEELIGDVRSLAVDLKKYIPKPGAAMSFSFISPRGLEGFSYDWSQNLTSDGSQKLTILDHVGGKPLAFAAGRAKYDPQDYEITVKWSQRGVYYFERLGLPLLDPEQQALYEKIRVELTPLAERLNQVTKLSWLPAFKDGQSALVLDAKLTSTLWQKDMPAAATPLPMLELGLVYGVSDAGLVKQASADYLALAREAVTRLNAIVPEFVPAIDIPAPQAREFPEGTVYYYSLPKDWGLDTQIAPNAALSDEFLALSLLPKFGLRLLKPTPLEVEGPLADHDRPLASAAYFDWAGVLDAVTPWIDYGIDQGDAITAAAAAAAGEEPPAETPVPETSPADMKAGTKAVLDFLKCLRTMSSATYVEDGAQVTHSEWHVVDQQ